RRIANVADVEERAPERVAHDDEAAHRQVLLQQVQGAAGGEVAVNQEDRRLARERSDGFLVTLAATAQRTERALGAVAANELAEVDGGVARVGDAPRHAAGDVTAEALGARAQLVPPARAGHRQESPDSRRPCLRSSSRRCLRSISAPRDAA